MNPAILGFATMALKAVMFKDVTPDAEKLGLNGRPFFLSRRFLHSAITAVVALGGMAGITIPADQAIILMDSVGQVWDVFTQNAGLWAGLVSTAGAIWGTIRAGKK